jgi:hypothetical protein
LFPRALLDALRQTAGRRMAIREIAGVSVRVKRRSEETYRRRFCGHQPTGGEKRQPQSKRHGRLQGTGSVQACAGGHVVPVRYAPGVSDVGVTQEGSLTTGGLFPMTNNPAALAPALGVFLARQFTRDGWSITRCFGSHRGSPSPPPREPARSSCQPDRPPQRLQIRVRFGDGRQ